MMDTGWEVAVGQISLLLHVVLSGKINNFVDWRHVYPSEYILYLIYVRVSV